MISCLVGSYDHFKNLVDGVCVVAVVVSVFCFGGAMGNTGFCTPRLACCQFHVGQNDDCLQIGVSPYSIRLSFGRVHYKFIDVDCNCVSPIEHHPCNVDKLVSDSVVASVLSRPSVIAVMSWWSW